MDRSLFVARCPLPVTRYRPAAISPSISEADEAAFAYLDDLTHEIRSRELLPHRLAVDLHRSLGNQTPSLTRRFHETGFLENTREPDGIVVGKGELGDFLGGVLLAKYAIKSYFCL